MLNFSCNFAMHNRRLVFIDDIDTKLQVVLSLQLVGFGFAVLLRQTCAVHERSV